MEKKILVTRPSMPPMEEYMEEIQSIWSSRWLTNMGPKHRKFQERLKKYLGVQHLELVTNGHMALELSLQSLHLKGEVITTPYTFASTTNAIVRSGLVPVFCDINPIDFTIDTGRLEGMITEKTCAIVPVHVYGNLCDVEGIGQIADKYGLKVIYDAAHSFGETLRGRSAADFGDISCLSFHATKVFNSIEGGAVCYHCEAFGEELRRMRNFGISGPEAVEAVGANAKMNEFCAAMGICNLRHLEQEIEKRRAAAMHYRSRLEGLKGVQLNPIQKEVRSNYAYFPVVFDEKEFGVDRDTIFEALARQGICARKYFYPITSSFSCFHGAYAPEQTPVALQVSRRVLALPLYAELSQKEIDRICRVIRSCQKA